MEESKSRLDAPDETSKSQRKREAREVRSLASRLVALNPSRLAQVPLDENVRSEVERARNIRSNVARKRQLQYIAKLLRRGDTGAVASALEAFDHEASHLNARHHRCEAWRDRLIEAGDGAIGGLLEQRRDVEAQVIRQLVRNARREAEKNRPPASARALFKQLRELDEAEPLPPLPTG